MNTQNIQITIGILLLLFLYPTLGTAQTEHSHLRDGDSHYMTKQYKKAEEEYRKAIDKKSTSTKGSFNLGN